MKICIQCAGSQPPENFYRHPNTVDKMSGVCKECHKARMRRRQRLNPAVREYDRMRAKTPERKAHLAANSVKWRIANPKGYKAQTAVNNGLRDGKITKEPCHFCCTEENLNAHHQDYSKPLDVIWLCAKCHHRFHAMKVAS